MAVIRGGHESNFSVTRIAFPMVNGRMRFSSSRTTSSRNFVQRKLALFRWKCYRWYPAIKISAIQGETVLSEGSKDSWVSNKQTLDLQFKLALLWQCMQALHSRAFLFLNIRGNKNWFKERKWRGRCMHQGIYNEIIYLKWTKSNVRSKQ